jgi:hypothetical protein
MSIPWPIPALLSWAAAWSVLTVGGTLGVAPVPALLLAAGLAAACSLRARTPARRFFIAGGFLLSVGASHIGAALPSWAWLGPLAVLLACYPMGTWRDAPLFPTPSNALRGLATLVPLPPAARIVDAGCGLGHGLQALRTEYPSACLRGLEWSWPIRVACAWRLGRSAIVSRADIWVADWSGFDMVYLFQRPESMPRAAVKAGRELRDGAWLASLEFALPQVLPDRVLRCGDGRNVWLYRAPFRGLGTATGEDSGELSPDAPDAARSAREPAPARSRRVRCARSASRAA